MTTVSISVPGLPQPQGSLAAFVRNGRALMASANPRTRPWRETVAWEMRRAYTGEAVRGPVTVTLAFWLPRPRRVSAKQRPNHTVKPDVDKLARACLDAGTGILWRDDAQVFWLRAAKWYVNESHPEPGVEIEVGL